MVRPSLLPLRACAVIFSALVFLLAVTAPSHAQVADPLQKPPSGSSSVGAYQYGIGMLKLDQAWELTRGRAHIAVVDVGAKGLHPELEGGINGNFRAHRSAIFTGVSPLPGNYHGLIVAGAVAARGFNGTGISGACPWCSLTIHEPLDGFNYLSDAMPRAIKSGTTAINMSLGSALTESEGNTPMNCDSAGTPLKAECAIITRAANRDIVVVSIAQNEANLNGKLRNGIPFPANHPNVIAVGGAGADGTFWTTGYDSSNPGSNWGPKVRLVAPAKDVLGLQAQGRYLYDFKAIRCGERVDSSVSADPTLPATYTGYGDCTGTSFAAPWVTAIAGLMRSANPLLTAAEVETILLDTATQPVSGPDGLTFYLPNAASAVQRALGAGNKNRLTPVFATYSADLSRHLFTTSPQMAVAAIAGDLNNGPANSAVFASIGQTMPDYPRFGGKICDGNNQNCIQPDARALFRIFTTENAPAGTTLDPLYRVSLACNPAQTTCAVQPQFAYATTASQVSSYAAQGYEIDMVEGYVFSASQPQPAGTLKLCMGTDTQRKDAILYAAAACDQTRLALPNGENTGGAYQSPTLLGYVYSLAAADATPKTGWWWNPAESGRGFFLEKNGNTLFMAAYYFEPDGRPTWFTSAGPMNGNTFNAQALTVRNGQTLEGDYRAPAPAVAIGPVAITFGSANEATMRWPGGTTPLSSFAFGGTGTISAESGWWWNAAESGRGFSIEVQGNTLFVAGFIYDAAGNPIWVLSAGPMQSATRYTGRINSVTGGQALNAPYKAPASVTDIGSLTIDFAGTDRATMTLPSGKQVPLTRFRF
jgi:serine protease